MRSCRLLDTWRKECWNCISKEGGEELSVRENQCKGSKDRHGSRTLHTQAKRANENRIMKRKKWVGSDQSGVNSERKMNVFMIVGSTTDDTDV